MDVPIFIEERLASASRKRMEGASSSLLVLRLLSGFRANDPNPTRAP
jgi:hypothetical protein